MFDLKELTLRSPIIKTIILLISFLKLQSFETTKIKTRGNRADDFGTNEFRSGKQLSSLSLVKSYDQLDIRKYVPTSFNCFKIVSRNQKFPSKTTRI